MNERTELPVSPVLPDLSELPETAPDATPEQFSQVFPISVVPPEDTFSLFAPVGSKDPGQPEGSQATDRGAAPAFRFFGEPDHTDYSQASTSSLRRSETRELTQLLTADFGHFVLKSLVLARQIIAFLRGEDVVINWDPQVTGLRPDLDEKERQASENLKAIWREQSLRRSVRQALHTKKILTRQQTPETLS